MITFVVTVNNDTAGEHNVLGIWPSYDEAKAQVDRHLQQLTAEGVVAKRFTGGGDTDDIPLYDHPDTEEYDHTGYYWLIHKGEYPGCFELV